MKNLTINVGDYVRTDIGEIRKVVRVTDDLYVLDKDIVFAHKDKIKISSPNIIDLIVVGDVLLIDISPDDCGGIVVLRSVETENDIKRYKSKFENKEYIFKGIITHEQIESMVYKIER